MYSIESITSRLNTSSRQQFSNISRPHEPWPEDISTSMALGSYMAFLGMQFGSWAGHIVGPDDWYLSRAEVYKYTKGKRHECFVATIQRTPRLPKPSTSALKPDYTGPVYLIIERNRVIDPQTEGRFSFSLNNLDREKFSWPPEFLIKCTHAIKPAFREESIWKLWVGKYELLGSVDFPTPSTVLPHEEDRHAVLDVLLAESRRDDTTPGLTRSPNSSTRPTFISLPMLIDLALSISKNKPCYTLSKNNRYWFCCMIFFALRRYTASNILVPVAGNPGIIIRPNDDIDIIKKTFRDAKLDPGRFGIFEIMKIPKDDKVEEILRKWEPDLKEMYHGFRTRRIEALNLVLDSRETEERRMYENLCQGLRRRGWTEEDFAAVLRVQRLRNQRTE